MNKLKNLLIAALLGVCAHAYAGPTLTIAASPNPVTVGSSVDLNVMIADVTDLYAYEFTLTFDAALFQATGITEGAFLGTAGPSYGDVGVIDNAAGTISFVFNTLLGPVPGASGGGSLAHITFAALAAGSSTLAFSDAIFLDSALNDIAVVAGAGTLQAVPEPSTFLLFGAGLIGVGALRRRRAG